MATELSHTYQDAGVNIDKGNELVTHIKTIAKKTHRKEVIGGIGGFAALFQLDLSRYKEPILVSSTDGVGTKLKLANQLNKHTTIGIDLVAMCVNDLIVCGAEPLFFLDYLATGQLEIKIATEVIQGIGVGCQQAGTALVGGETAEMPGFYQNKEYDLAGFAVGVVEKSAIITGEKIKPGDVLLGLASSGPHSNGYSLIRKIIDIGPTPLSTPFADTTLGEVLLQPTRIYVKSIQALMAKLPIHGIAHITGGGFYDNIPRILPAHTKACLYKSSWSIPTIFQWIQQQGHIAEKEMFRTFNCGIGLVICLPASSADDAIGILSHQGEKVFKLGEIHSSSEEEPFVEIL